MKIKNTMYKEKILEYYKNKNIQISDLLFIDIENNKQSTLTYVSYAIENLIGVNGIETLLERIATSQKTTTDAERSYHNLKTEFQSFYFVQHVLDLKILEIDNPWASTRPNSPNAKSDKYFCDITATDSSEKFYFEVKDFSDLFETDENSLPKIVDYGIQVERWIVGKCQESYKKGFNFLIARIDLEVDFCADIHSTINYFHNNFVHEICSTFFKIKDQASKNEYNVLVNFNIPSFLYGVYIIFGKSFLKLNFVK